MNTTIYTDAPEVRKIATVKCATYQTAPQLLAALVNIQGKLSYVCEATKTGIELSGNDWQMINDADRQAKFAIATAQK